MNIKLIASLLLLTFFQMGKAQNKNEDNSKTNIKNKPVMTAKTYSGDGLPSLSLYNVAFTVTDIDQSIKWYKDILGFELKNKSTFALPTGSANAAILALGDLKLELLQVPGGKKLPEMFAAVPMHLIPIGNKAIVFQVTDLKTATRQLEAKGVKFVWKEQYLAGDKMLCTMIEDVDGNKINIFQTNTTFQDLTAANNFDAEDIAQKHLELWGNRSTEMRKKLIDALYSDNVKIFDPTVSFEGKEKMNDFITELQSQHPGYIFTLEGKVSVNGSTIKFNWKYEGKKGGNKITGTDVLSIKKGAVDTITVFVDDLK